ncbi:Xaa-Pro dipeptidase [Algibacillus agarilyticus]|uniref:Xaa-Pro dipeptidase n=1 Tax=Algibacillus agarilyticus TaxID=2234133 RepID=UPI000DCFDCC7|nr:Xaa-Pro dipeptidase [Algibacillus agarilyticus]
MSQLNDNLTKLYQSHLTSLQSRVKDIIQLEKIDALVIHSGQTKRQFLDDMDYPFKVNPHFKAWLPVLDVPNSWLIVDGINKPKLIYFQPHDFWHKVIKLGDEFWQDAFDIQILTQANQVEALLPRVLNNHAYIGEHLEVAQALGFDNINPEPILNHLHFYRAYKTEYEQMCMREATKIGIQGHLAAKDTFYAGGSEFDIHLAFLQAAQLNEHQLPYNNIVALNQNAATLHYTYYERHKPSQHLSFLIDAGGQFNGYASDITRTYAAKKGVFAELINRLDQIQLDLVASLKPNMKFGDLHIQCHHKIAQLLVEFGLVTISAKEVIELNITASFFPHGLGHPLGLQVHDVGGFMADARGTHREPPEGHPYLRTTRIIEPNMVVTIEPGLYFIDCLLNSLSKAPQGKYINWQRVEALKPFGGIRIEDNIIVHATFNENMTRDLGL